MHAILPFGSALKVLINDSAEHFQMDNMGTESGIYMRILGIHIVQGVPRANETVCRASSFVRTVSSRTSNDGVVLQ